MLLKNLVRMIRFLYFLQFFFLVQAVELECIPFKLCPLAVELAKNRKYSPEVIHFLRSSHCGEGPFDYRIWCPIFKKCISPDEKFGTCVPIKKCKSFLQLIRFVDTSDEYNLSYLRDFRCNSEFDEEIYVCCHDHYNLFHHNNFNYPEDRIDDTPPKEKKVITQKRFHQILPNPELEECGIKAETDDGDRIIGGTATGLTDHPWMAVLKYQTNKGPKYGCQGVLINSKYVLTAAHCLDEYTLRGKGLGQLQQVVLGDYDINNKTDCIYYKNGKDCADPPQIHEVDSTISHEKFNVTTTANDIALIKLTRSATFSDYVKPICLPNEPVKLIGNESFTIVGWGISNLSNIKDLSVKRQAVIKLNKASQCNERSPFKLSKGQICVGNGNGVDSCSGDSGGPLINRKLINSRVVNFLYGIISHGFTPCGNYPSVNTYIPYYMDWILKNIE